MTEILQHGNWSGLRPNNTFVRLHNIFSKFYFQRIFLSAQYSSLCRCTAIYFGLLVQHGNQKPIVNVHIGNGVDCSVSFQFRTNYFRKDRIYSHKEVHVARKGKFGSIQKAIHVACKGKFIGSPEGILLNVKGSLCSPEGIHFSSVP